MRVHGHGSAHFWRQCTTDPTRPAATANVLQTPFSNAANVWQTFGSPEAHADNDQPAKTAISSHFRQSVSTSNEFLNRGRHRAKDRLETPRQGRPRNRTSYESGRARRTPSVARRSPRRSPSEPPHGLCWGRAVLPAHHRRGISPCRFTRKCYPTSAALKVPRRVRRAGLNSRVGYYRISR